MSINDFSTSLLRTSSQVSDAGPMVIWFRFLLLFINTSTAARKSIGGSARKKIPSPIAEKSEDVEMEVGVKKDV